MKYSSNLKKIAIILVITTFCFLSIESKKKYRYVTQTSKDLYRSRTQSEMMKYFGKDGLFNADNTLAPFILSKDTVNVNFVDRIFSTENKIDPSKAKLVLNDNCSASYESGVFTMSYKNIKVKYTNGKDTVDANVSFVVELNIMLEKTYSAELTGEFSFKVKYLSLELKSIDSSNEEVKTFLNTNIDAFKTSVSKEYDVIVLNSVSVLNDLNNLAMELNTTLLTDSKSRTMTISRLENPTCATEFIIEKFSSQIFSGYEPTASTNYEFTDSEDQAFYDISLFDELMKSKTNNLSFSFLYNKENGLKYNTLGFTINDLANIFPSVLSQFRGSQEYLVECAITNAFSKVVNKLNSDFQEFIQHYEELQTQHFSVFDLTKLHSHPSLKDTFLLNSASLKCDVKVDGAIVETVNLLLNFDMSNKKVENDLVFSLQNLYLIDYKINSKIFVNDKALTHLIVSSLGSYFDNNPLNLFKLNVEGREYMFNKEGTLIYKPKPKEVESIDSDSLLFSEEFLKYLK